MPTALTEKSIAIFQKLLKLAMYFFMLILLLFFLFLLYWVSIHPYFATTYDFHNYQKLHQNILETGKIKAKNPKRLLSYRYRKTFGFDGVSSCYVNFYQLPDNFDMQAFLKNYQLTTKHDLKKQYENYGGSIHLESCLNTTSNIASLKTNQKQINKNLFLNYHYHRDFLVYGSTKNVHLMDLNSSSQDVEIYAKIENIEYKPNAILLDKRNNIVKMATIYSSCVFCD